MSAKAKAEYESIILTGMARSLWVMAFADHAEESGGPKPHGGGDWGLLAPETPDGAIDAAKDLTILIADANDLAGATPLADLFGVAMQAEYDAPHEFTLPIDHFDEELANEFGDSLGHMGVGSGSSWFDDHKRFPWSGIFFECHYDGEDLTWSGRVMDADAKSVHGSEVSATEKIGTVTIVNASDKSWTKHSYVLAFGAYGDTLLLAYANSLDDALDECIDWIAEHAPGLLADDAVADEYKRLRAEGKSEDAAREEAEIDTTTGGNAGNYLNSWEWTIVAEDPSLDTVKTIGKRTATRMPPRNNPARRSARGARSTTTTGRR